MPHSRFRPKIRETGIISNIEWLGTYSTGITGLIGGDYLHLISQRHRDWHIVALVRDKLKARVLQEHYPFVEVILGTLEDTEILESESERANVVLSMLA